MCEHDLPLKDYALRDGRSAVFDSPGKTGKGQSSVSPTQVNANSTKLALAWLRQLRDHARQKLQLVDPLHVLTSMVRTLTLFGVTAARPVVEHLALLAVPLHPLEAQDKSA
jgi:hypothetical protein